MIGPSRTPVLRERAVTKQKFKDAAGIENFSSRASSGGEFQRTPHR